MDVNGFPISNNVEYEVAVLVVGTGNYQLSQFSKPFNLLDQGIYCGTYFIGWYEECITGF